MVSLKEMLAVPDQFQLQSPLSIHQNQFQSNRFSKEQQRIPQQQYHDVQLNEILNAPSMDISLVSAVSEKKFKLKRHGSSNLGTNRQQQPGLNKVPIKRIKVI